VGNSISLSGQTAFHGQPDRCGIAGLGAGTSAAAGNAIGKALHLVHGLGGLALIALPVSGLVMARQDADTRANGTLRLMGAALP
jgi:hypothetical protein